MKMTIHGSNSVKVLSIEGAMNASTSREVETRLNKLILGGNKKLVVNLDRLKYISSAGLRVFLAADKMIKKNDGALRLCCLNNTVKEVFEISGFQLIFSIFSTEEAALDGF